MLLAIREKVTGWIAYGIIFLISVPFALWGMNSYFGGGEIAPAATVNGEEITQSRLDRAYANYRQRLIQLFGGSIPASFGDENALRAQVLNQLVEEFALRQYIEDKRYRIGDQDLNQIIWDMEIFHTDGQFNPELYQAQLRSIGYNSEGLKLEVQQSRVLEQFQNGIRATAFVIPASKKRYASLGNQTRKIRSLTHRVDHASIEIGDAEIEAHYQQNADLYRTPEQVRIDYIELNLDGIKENIEVDESLARARYRESLAIYSSAETRVASHILIKVDDETDSVAARTQIDALRQRIVAGESFADVARQHSQDTISAEDGGDLGEIERGVMVQAFENALFALELDELSEPVQTAYGWHLIQLHEILGGEVQPFEAVQAQLEDEIRTEMAESQIFDLVENLSNLTYEQPDSLEPAAEQLELTIQTSDWFGRNSGDGIASDPRVRNQAFSDLVLVEKLNSEAIELGPDEVVFIRLNERQQPQTRPLAEVRDQIRQELVEQRARELGESAGVAALAELESGKSLDDLALEWNSPVIDHGFVERRQANFDAALLGAAFTMPRPEQGPVFEGQPLATGEYAIIELSAILSNDSESDQGALNRLASAQGNAEYQSVTQFVANQAEVARTPIEELNY